VVINTASVAAFDGQIGQAAYSASKGGIVGHDAPGRARPRRAGIRVMTIAAGIFDTPLLATLPEPVRASLAKAGALPAAFRARPDEFAALALHIIENAMLNGEDDPTRRRHPDAAPVSASRRTSRGWGPAVRGEFYDGKCEPQDIAGLGPAVRGEFIRLLARVRTVFEGGPELRAGSA